MSSPIDVQVPASHLVVRSLRMVGGRRVDTLKACWPVVRVFGLIDMYIYLCVCMYVYSIYTSTYILESLGNRLIFHGIRPTRRSAVPEQAVGKLIQRTHIREVPQPLISSLKIDRP